jgi:hypothetical protein
MTTYDPFDYNCEVIASGNDHSDFTNYIKDTILSYNYDNNINDTKTKVKAKIEKLKGDGGDFNDQRRSKKYSVTYDQVDFTSKKKYSSSSIIQVILEANDRNIYEAFKILLKRSNISYNHNEDHKLISINFKQNKNMRIMFWNDSFMDVWLYFNSSSKIRSIHGFHTIYLLVDTTKMMGDGIKILDLDGYGTRLDINNKNYKQNLLNDTPHTQENKEIINSNVINNNMEIDSSQDPEGIIDDQNNNNRGGSKKTKKRKNEKTKKRKNKKTRKQKK